MKDYYIKAEEDLMNELEEFLGFEPSEETGQMYVASKIDDRVIDLFF